jgi:type IX secretion system PorP/SprF family membrane protein
MKKKRFIFFFFLSFIFGEINAQLDAQYSQYMENQAATNPGSIAENEMLNLSGVYRQQWAGFKNAPSDMFFSVNTPIRIAEAKHGIGLGFSIENIGLFKNQSVLLQYSYKMELLDGVLGLGLNAGFVNQTFNRNDADPTGNGGQSGDGDDYHKQDDIIISSATEDGDIAFDAGVGCFFSNKNMYAGLSVLHLTAPKMDFGGSAILYVPRIFYLTGGYNISLSNTFYVLKPSTLIKTDFSTFQIELTGLLEYKEKIQGGISYRFQDAFVFMIGINLFNGLYAGYSYDLPVSKMIRSGGSHEISLRYSFKPEFTKKNKHKAERIL